MEHFHYRNKCQIGHFFMNFHYARYENLKKSVPPKFKNEASDHLKGKQELTRLRPREIWGEDDMTWCMRHVAHVNRML